MKVRELITRLGFEADETQLKRYEEGLKSVKRGMIGLTAVVGGASAAVLGLAKNVANTGNEMAKASREAGLSIQQYQELRFAMQRLSRASEGEIDRAFGTITQSIGRARREGGRYADALVAIGFTQEEIASGSINSEQALNRLATALKRTTNDADAAVLAGDLFGDRIGRRLGPAIRNSSDSVDELRQRFKDLGGGMANEATEAAEAFEDSMLDLKTIMTAIKNEVGTALLPVVRAMAEEFTGFLQTNREILSARLGEFFKGLAGFLQLVFRAGMATGSAFVFIAKHVGGVEMLVKLLMLGLTALFSSMVISGLAKMGMALKAMGLLAALPLIKLAAIAAAIAAIILVAEDVYAYFNGDDSVTGLMVKKFGWVWESLKNGAQWAFDTIIASAKFWADVIIGIVEKVLAPIKAVKDSLGSILGASATGVVSGFNSAMRFVSGGTDVGTAADDSLVRQTVREANNSNSLQQNNTINVNAGGSDPATVHESVVRGIDESVEDLFRRSNFATQTAAGY